jgi:DNA-binding NarL/FixJ family response regulator
MGATALEADVAALSRRGRVPLAGEDAPEAPEQTEAERLGLTPRELEVLLLVADGRTNREIGTAL